MTYFTVLVRNSGLEELKQTIETLTGHPLRSYSGLVSTSFESRVLQTRVRLFEADLEDDQNIPFSSFKYAVDLELESNILDVRQQRDWLRVLSLMFGKAISRALDCECIVVENLQHLVYDVEDLSK